MTTGKMVLKLAAQVINLNATLGKKMITKRNMLIWVLEITADTIPHYLGGGNLIINGRNALLSNTCPVYSLLYMTYHFKQK